MNEIEKNSRIVATVSRQLQVTYEEKGFGYRNHSKQLKLVLPILLKKKKAVENKKK